MRRWLTAWRLDLRATLRSLLPNRLSRILLLVLVPAAGCGLTLALLLAPLPASASDSLQQGLGGFLLVGLGIATSASVVAVARIMTQPQRIRLLLTAPAPPSLAIGVPVATTSTLALLPLTVIVFPFALGSLRFAPQLAILMLLSSAMSLAWALCLSLTLLAVLSRRFGRESASRIAFGLSVLAGIGSLAGFGPLLVGRVGLGPVLVFLGVSAIVLPSLLGRATRNLFAIVLSADAPRQSPIPTWSSRKLWIRLLSRTPGLWLFVGGIPLCVALLQNRSAVHGGAVALLLVSLATLPLNQLLAPVYENPDPFRLAPGSAAVLRSLWTCIGLPVLVAVAGLTVLVGNGRRGWGSAVIGVMLVSSLGCLVLSRGARSAVALLCLAVAAATEVLW